MNDDLLRTSLLDFWHALGDDARGVLLGGGYGLYLKQLHLAETAARTLLPGDSWPAPRATQDLDLFLNAEIVADVESMSSIRRALDGLGYVVVPGSEYLQFYKNLSESRAVKIDLLTAQLAELQQSQTIRADSRRARPSAKNHPQLHAHPTDGALALTESPLTIQIDGRLSSGQPAQALVAIPQAFSYLLMKLTAYRDRRRDAKKDYARQHALDLFRIVAMLTEEESEQIRRNVERFSDDPQVRSCAELIAADFAHPTAAGVLAMREHPLWQNDAQLAIFSETILGILR